MAYNIYSDVEFNKNLLYGAGIQTITDGSNAPSSPVESQLVYFDGTTPGGDFTSLLGEGLYFHNGSNWRQMIPSNQVSTAATVDLIPRRITGGQITVPATPTNNTDATSKQYVDGLVAGLIDLRGSFDITTNPADYPTGDAGNAVNATQVGDGSGPSLTIAKGDAWYIVGGTGTIGPATSITVEDGDLLVALVDNATNAHADWIILNTNLNIVSATETEAGIVELATQAETDAGTNDTTAVTPLKLATYINTTLGINAAFYKTAISTLSGETTTFNVGTGQAATIIRHIQFFNGSHIPVTVNISAVAYSSPNIQITWATGAIALPASSYAVIGVDKI